MKSIIHKIIFFIDVSFLRAIHKPDTMIDVPIALPSALILAAKLNGGELHSFVGETKIHTLLG